MSEFLTLSMAKAKSIIDEYDAMPSSIFAEQVDQWKHFQINDQDTLSPFYKGLRSDILYTFTAAGDINAGQQDKNRIDLLVGLRLYLELSKAGITLTETANDDVWRYMSVIVFPDITYLRYPKPEKGGIHINQKRFYRNKWRIWLKTLWWYIYLGWQGDKQATYDALNGNGANIISQFVERSGSGYRLSLFRCIMAEYAKQPKRKDELFAAAAKLNLAQCKTIEPSLSAGGEEGYVHKLFKYLTEEAYWD